MEAELKALAAAARAAGNAIQGNPGLTVSTTKDTHPPRKKKVKKKKERKDKTKDTNKKKESSQSSSSSSSSSSASSATSAAPSWKTSSTTTNTTSGGRPRRPSFDAASSSYGRHELQKPPPVVATTTSKFAGKKITFGDAEETTDKYDTAAAVTPQEDDDVEGSASLNGALGLGKGSSNLWFDNTPPSLVDGVTKAKLSFDAGKKLEGQAEVLWEKEIAAYTERKEKGGKSSSDGKWLRTVMRNGTLSDRVAAMSMVVQESVLHNFNTLTALVAMTKKRGSREAHLAIEAVSFTSFGQVFLCSVVRCC